jgi:hypothetical protein
MNYLEFIIDLEKQTALFKVAMAEAEKESWFHRHPYLTAAAIGIPLTIASHMILKRLVPYPDLTYYGKLTIPGKIIGRMLHEVGRKTMLEAFKLRGLFSNLPYHVEKLLKHVGFSGEEISKFPI